ncbi:hypothetical protein ACH6CV_01900 [Bacillota bacterium Meth-B3]
MTSKEVAKSIDVPKFPEHIHCEQDGKRIVIKLSERAVGCANKKNANMQEDEAAFETWVLLFHEKTQREVLLDVQEGVHLKDIDQLPHKHYGRFLYRALRFSEGFGWFKLSEPIKKKADDLKKLLKDERTINNVPNSKNDEGDSNKLEAQVEKVLEEMGVSFLPEVDLHRQLPVGLFKSDVKSNNNIFTGGKSAIDLWGIDGDAFHLIELKAGGNKKLGIISEMFFYANYAYDVFCNGRFGGEAFTINQELGIRGYQEILNRRPAAVCAHTLVEKGKEHPALQRALTALREYEHDRIMFDGTVNTHDICMEITIDSLPNP